MNGVMSMSSHNYHDCRLQLAYMHYNHNVNRVEADAPLDVVYIKYRGGKATVKPRRGPPNFGESHPMVITFIIGIL